MADMELAALNELERIATDLAVATERVRERTCARANAVLRLELDVQRLTRERDEALAEVERLRATVPPEGARFDAYTIDRVTAVSDGWDVGFGGLGLHVPNTREKTPPQVGEELRAYSKELFSDVHGIVIGGRVYRYQHPDAHRAEMRRRARVAVVKLTSPPEPRHQYLRDIAKLRRQERVCPRVLDRAAEVCQQIIDTGLSPDILSVYAGNPGAVVSVGKLGEYRVNVRVGWVHSVGPVPRADYYKPEHDAYALTLNSPPWDGEQPRRIASWLRQNHTSAKPAAVDIPASKPVHWQPYSQSHGPSFAGIDANGSPVYAQGGVIPQRGT